jgi:hypothetical protein
MIARMAGEWDIRLRVGTSRHRGDSVEILGHMTVPDSTVRQRAPAHVFQARGTYELNPISRLTGLPSWCDVHRGSIGIYTVEGDADSLYMEFGPRPSTDFERPSRELLRLCPWRVA